MKTKITQEQLDRYNNKYNTGYKLEDADKNGNIGCKNCTTCYNCLNCLDCLDCSYCFGCHDCSDCLGCSGCSYCYRCSDCSRCYDCSACSACSDCSYNINNNKFTIEEYKLKIKELNNDSDRTFIFDGHTHKTILNRLCGFWRNLNEKI